MILTVCLKNITSITKNLKLYKIIISIFSIICGNNLEY